MKKISIEIDEDVANTIQVIAYDGTTWAEAIRMMVEHICDCKKYWEEYKEWGERN